MKFRLVSCFFIVVFSIFVSCNKPKCCPKGSIQKNITDSISHPPDWHIAKVNLCIPIGYQRVSKDANLNSDIFYNEYWPSYFNPFDSSFIVISGGRVIKRTRPQSHLLFDPMTIDAAKNNVLLVTPFIIDTSCEIKSFIFIEKDLDVIRSAFYKAGGPEMDITFHFRKAQNETFQIEVAKALKILQSLEIEGVSVCFNEDTKFNNTKNFTYDQYASYVDCVYAYFSNISDQN